MATGLRSKSANIFVYILLGLLIVGLAGFGVGSFGGNVRAIGKVGDTDIPVDVYYRSLQNELSALTAQTGTPVSMAQATQMGLDQVVLARVVALTALEDEAKRLGLSAGDVSVLADIKDNRAFSGAAGVFDEETYRFVLQQSGLSPAQYEDQVRADLARSILNTAVTGGLAPSQSYTDTITSYIAERRDFEWARLGPDALSAPVAAPDEAALTAYYEANPDRFTLPEQRRVKYVWLSPDMMLDKIEISDDDLRARYDARIAEFDRPEARLVERLIFGTQTEADTARAALDAGTSTFEDLVTARGLTLADVDMGDVTISDLAPGAAEAVFAVTEPGIVGPAESALGPALYRVNAILPAQKTSFEDARPRLRDDALRDAAIRQVADQVTAIDDLLAGGATLEEVAADTDMTLGEVILGSDQPEGLSGYAEFRDAVVAASVGDYAEVAELPDGGIYAFELLEVIPPSLQPLDAVRDSALKGWTEEATRAALLAQADALLGQLESGVKFSELGLDALAESGLTRDRFVAGAPPALLSRAFELSPGQAGTVEGVDDVYIVRLTGVLPPDPADPDVASYRDALDQQYEQGLGSDLLDLFAQNRISRAGIDLNQAAINAVHAQIP